MRHLKKSRKIGKPKSLNRYIRRETKEIGETIRKNNRKKNKKQNRNDAANKMKQHKKLSRDAYLIHPPSQRYWQK